MICVVLLFSACGYATDGYSKDTTETTIVTETTTDDTTTNQTTEITTPTTEMVDLIEKEELAVPLDKIEQHGKSITLYGDVAENEELKALETELNKYGKKFSVVIWSLDGTKALSYNTNATFFSACTIKAGFALYCCRQIDAGVVSKDEEMTYEAKHYHGGSGKIRYNSYGSKYTIQYLIEQSLNISDNVAYKMLLDRFGTKGYDEYMRSIGANTLVLNGRTWGSAIKAQDLIRVWNEMNNYFKEDTVASNFLQKCCTGSPYNYGTQMLENCTYSHKSGDNFGTNAAYNDAGIVWTKDGGYAYAILSKSEGEYVDRQIFSTVMKKVNNVFG